MAAPSCFPSRRHTTVLIEPTTPLCLPPSTAASTRSSARRDGEGQSAGGVAPRDRRGIQPAGDAAHARHRHYEMASDDEVNAYEVRAALILAIFNRLGRELLDTLLVRSQLRDQGRRRWQQRPIQPVASASFHVDGATSISSSAADLMVTPLLDEPSPNVDDAYCRQTWGLEARHVAEITGRTLEPVLRGGYRMNYTHKGITDLAGQRPPVPPSPWALRPHDLDHRHPKLPEFGMGILDPEDHLRTRWARRTSVRRSWHNTRQTSKQPPTRRRLNRLLHIRFCRHTRR